MGKTKNVLPPKENIGIQIGNSEGIFFFINIFLKKIWKVQIAYWLTPLVLESCRMGQLSGMIGEYM